MTEHLTASLAGSSGEDSPNQRVGGPRLTGLLEVCMNEKRIVFQSVGGISIELSDEALTIEQDDLVGGDSTAVWIPRPLIRQVLSAIFSGLDSCELKEIAELAETFAKSPKA